MRLDHNFINHENVTLQHEPHLSAVHQPANDYDYPMLHHSDS